MKIKVPFKRGAFYREKEVEFLFNIGSLECASEEILKCELHELKDQDPFSVSVAVIYGAYLTACRKNYKRPRYSMYNATVWIENMSRESNVTFQKGMSELFSKNNEKDGKEKKK